MWAQFKIYFHMYKWIGIVVLVSALTIAVVVQSNRVSDLKSEQETLQEDKKKLEEKVNEISNNFDNYKTDVDKALTDLESLRNKLNNVSATTERLRRQIGGLKNPPASDGANHQEIEDTANQITKDLLDRFQTNKGTK